MRTRSALTAAVVALALVAGGCGGDSAEQQAEDAIKEATGGSADVDINDGTMQITTDTGNVTVSGDEGSVKIESDEGTYQMGKGTKLPDGFPGEVPVPNGELASSMSSDGTFAVLYKVDDVKQAFTDYLKALESAGFELSDKSEGEMNGKFFGTVTATGKGWEVGVSATASGGEKILGLTVQRPS